MPGERGPAFGCRLDGVNRPQRFRFVLDIFFQCLHVAADDHQQIVEVVSDSAGELAERIHLLRFRELPLHALELLLGLTAFRDIPRDLCETDEISEVVANGVNNDAGPEKGTVLTNPPTFFVVSPRGTGNV